MKEFQTPQRDQIYANRRSKSARDLIRNLRKVTKKSLDPEFTAVVDDDTLALCGSVEVDTPASQTVVVSDLSSPSSSITCDENVVFSGSINKCEISGTSSLEKSESIEARIVISCLHEARNQVLKSKDLGHSSDFLAALISYVIGEISSGGGYENKNWLDKLRLRNANMVFLPFILWILVCFVIWFFSFGSEGVITGPLPT